MKKFIRIVLILATVLLFVVACSEKIFLHDGKDGVDGINGKNGLSIVTKIDPIYATDKVTIIGNTTSYYTDVDSNGSYSTGDIFQNSFSLFNGKDGTNGTNGANGLNGSDASIKITYKVPCIPNPAANVICPPSECPIGSILMESYTGTILKGSISYCLPIPVNGTNGLDGYSPVMRVREVKDGSGKVIGNESQFFLDLNRDGKVSINDTYMGGFIVLNGADGYNGKTPNITITVADGYFIISSTIDGIIVNSKKIQLPKDGLNGYSPVMTTEPYKDESGILVGNIMKFWLDLDRNGAYSLGDSFMNSIIVLNGVKGQDGITKICTINFDITDSVDCPSGKNLNFNSSIDGKVIDSISICLPKDGQDANDNHEHVCVKKTIENDGHEKFEWYRDNNRNNKYDDGDTKLGECNI